MLDTPSSSSGLLAAIDMGSNSFRLEIGRVQDGRYSRHLYRKEMVRLGAGLDSQGLLSDAAAERGLGCLRQFARELQGVHPGQVRAVATQTLREARNRHAFLSRAEAVLGLPIEVVSGREEARLIYAGVSFLQPSPQRRLVIDIGGRSTELILGCGRTPGDAESFPIGSVSLSMRYFPDGQLTAAAFRAAQVAAGAVLEESLHRFPAERWDEALGSSGTAGAVSSLLKASGVSDGRLSADGLRWLIDACIQAGHIDRLALPGLKPERRPVLAGGLAILYTLAMHFGTDAMRPAKGALRQGVIVDLHERLRAAQADEAGVDLRDQTVSALQQRFRVDTAQAARVSAVALALQAQLLPQASREHQQELHWAAALHEMGMMVSHHDHHRHSAYLLAHVDADGFSQNQQERLGAMVLGQRGGLRKMEAHLRHEPQALQLLCLRLAVIKCHARGAVEPDRIRLRRRGRAVRLTMPEGVRPDPPQTLHLLREEAEHWARSGVLALSVAG